MKEDLIEHPFNEMIEALEHSPKKEFWPNKEIQGRFDKVSTTGQPTFWVFLGELAIALYEDGTYQAFVDINPS